MECRAVGGSLSTGYACCLHNKTDSRAEWMPERTAQTDLLSLCLAVAAALGLGGRLELAAVAMAGANIFILQMVSAAETQGKQPVMGICTSKVCQHARKLA